MKKIFLLMFLLCSTNLLFAMRILSGNNIVVDQTVNEDLYIIGGTVTINAAVQGDVIVAGGTIIMNGPVLNDVIVAGGKVTIKGIIGDDVRGIGGELHLQGTVVGDLVVSGGNITIEKTASINGNVLAGGGTVVIDGVVHGSLKSAATNLTLNGTIDKEADCNGQYITVNGIINGKSTLAATHITLGNDAAFNQDVRYWQSPGKLDFKQAVKGVTAIYDPILQVSSGKLQYLGFATFIGFTWYILSVFLFILLIQYGFRNRMKSAADEAYEHTLRSIGSGLLYFIVTPLAILLVMITIIGIPIGIIALIAYVVTLLLGTIISSVITANWIKNRANYQWSNMQLSLAALVVFILFKFLIAIPFAGWTVMCVITCLTFGGIVKNIHFRRRTKVAAIS